MEAAPRRALGSDIGERKLIAGKYELLRPIGRGRFAIVWRSRRLADDETVALKKIAVESMDPKTREKCLKEVRLLQSLEHPNIVRYYDSMLEGDELVIVFEWAAAGDLKRQIRKAVERGAPFEERVIWKYFVQMADALAHMHERRVLHRDLKPANIFLTLDGTVKVGDLGLGRMMSEHTVEAHSKVGTPLYMSPEVLRGDGYDWKCDVWSLGCVLYELGMLRSPFKAEGLNLFTLFQKISSADFEALPDHYSKTLKDLAYRMLSVDPSQRPAVADAAKIAAVMRRDTMSAAARLKEDQRIQQQQEQQQQQRVGPDTPSAAAAAPDPDLERRDSRELERRDSRFLEAEQPGSEPEFKQHPQDSPLTTRPESVRAARRPSARDAAQVRRQPKPRTDGADRIPSSRAAPKDTATLEVEPSSEVPSDRQSGRRTRPTFDEGRVPHHEVIIASESIAEKLYVIGYQRERAEKGEPMVSRWHFAFEGCGFNLPRARQFADAAHATAFAVGMVNGDCGFVDDVDDHPIRAATGMLASLGKLGMPAHVAANATPHDLVRGFGRPLCEAMDWITGQALKTMVIPPPEYPREDDDDDDDDVVDDAGDDDIADMTDFVYEHTDDETLFPDVPEFVEPGGDVEVDPDRALMEAAVDPAAWALEVERVGPRLAAATKSFKFGVATSWRGRLETCVAELGRLDQARRNGWSESTDFIAKNAKADADRLEKGEALLLRLLDAKADHYASEKKTVDRLNADLDALHISVAAKTDDLDAASNAAADARRRLQACTDGMDMSSRLQDMRNALATLKADITSLDLAIGVVQHRCTSLRLRHLREGIIIPSSDPRNLSV